MLVISFQTLNAQSITNNKRKWEYTVSAEWMTPATHNLYRTNNMGFGLSAIGEHYIYSKTSVSLLIGYNHFPGSRYSHLYESPYIYPAFAVAVMWHFKGVPFEIIPLMAGFNYYPMKWLCLSAYAGTVMGGSKNDFKINWGYEPNIGFLIPFKTSFIKIGIKALYTNLKVQDTYFTKNNVYGRTDFAQTMGISLGWKF